MPIDHRCPRCQQLLSVPSERAGTIVVCSVCGASSIVEPALVGARQEGAGAAVPTGQYAGSGSELATIPVVPPPPRSPAWSEPPPPRQPATNGAARLSMDLSGLVLVSRRAIYLQGVLFCAVAALGFVTGYGMAQREAAVADAADDAVADAPVPVHGVINYGPKGVLQKDAGAVIIALPVAAQPEEKIPIRGLQVDEPPGPYTKIAVDAIQALGGDCVRADASGAFELVVKRPGKYRLLIISRNAVREKREKLPAQTLGEMGHYFAAPNELIGLHRWRWTTEQLDAKTAPIVHTFPTAGG